MRSCSPAPAISDESSVFPNVLLAGMPKSGTSTIAKMLASHVSFFVPKAKELHFLATHSATEPQLRKELAPVDQYADSIIRMKIEDYLGHYGKAPASASFLVDASPSSAVQPGRTISNIFRIFPSPQSMAVLFLVRNPYEVAYSHYLMQVRNRIETRSFTESITACLQDGTNWRRDQLRVAKASLPIKLFHEVWGTPLLVRTDEIASNASAKLSAYFGVPPEGFSQPGLVGKNPVSEGPGSTQQFRQEFREVGPVLDKEVSELEQLLGDGLPSWYL